MVQKKLIVLAGPTAVGKTKLSILLAKRIGGEIISADSMQVYRGMDIGSAKIRPEEMEGVRHHLIDVLDPAQSFDVVQFQSLAKEAIEEITSRGRIPILVGGTGFYIQSVVYDVDFTENDGDVSFRRMLEKINIAVYTTKFLIIYKTAIWTRFSIIVTQKSAISRIYFF